ncbi:translation factor SUA5 [Tepidamorphus gemmatus]|uniref:Threonylcarbamoyl-AMP synthase n=1 Tax=Tepidamorphus gemmatus TaxID=747076 RepID=A0A4V2UYZ1_9HYPH|nr:translation factor SUA5 [Tepidamorphus gemmatus]
MSDLIRLDPAAGADLRGTVAATAARHLAAGELVVLPTETVYGLAADATDSAAVARLYAAKGRPTFNPLISHVADRAMAEAHGLFDATAARLADAFWPGPLTLVVPRRPGSAISELVTAGLDTVGLRLPDSAVARDVARLLDRPFAAPSANRSGRISPTTADAAIEELGMAVALVIDAGPCRVGLESTIVACVGPDPVLLRPGGIARASIEAVLGRPLALPDFADPERPQAPGMLAAHYAPNARVRLDACTVEPGEALLAFGPRLPAGTERAVMILNLSAAGDPTEAAANLFTWLRRLDASGASTIAVAPIPDDGLGEAINDRLRRAAVR